MKSLVFHLCLICILFTDFLFAEDWPQWRGPNRDGRWQDSQVVDTLESPLSILWRTPVSRGYSGVTVSEGRVYTMDRLKEPDQFERVLCLDAATGKQLWSHIYPCEYKNIGYPAGPRASVTIDDKRAYSLGAMGHLHCLDATTGKVLWCKDMDKEYDIKMPTWGIACAPLRVLDMLVVQIGGKENACVVALDRITGQEKWRALEGAANYSSPIVIKQAGKEVIVSWTQQQLAGLEPESGKILWRCPFSAEMGIATPVLHGNYLFVSSFFDGSLLVKLKEKEFGFEVVWQRKGASEKKTDSLHCCISTPVILGDYIYGVDSYGELRCLELPTGDRVWESLEAVPQARWANIHMVQNGERTWMFNERGELIISRLTPQGFDQISRAQLIRPTGEELKSRGGVCWAHPAFANGRVYARNDEELVCSSLRSND